MFNKLIDYIPNIIGFICMAIIFGSCIHGIRVLCRDDAYARANHVKWEPCIAHLHSASKEMTVKAADYELGEARRCLVEIRDICSENTDEFNQKWDRLLVLSYELKHFQSNNPVDEEVMLQKVNRVIFDGGQSCYKGSCRYKTYPFICSEYKKAL